MTNQSVNATCQGGFPSHDSGFFPTCPSPVATQYTTNMYTTNSTNPNNPPAGIHPSALLNGASKMPSEKHHRANAEYDLKSKQLISSPSSIPSPTGGQLPLSAQNGAGGSNSTNESSSPPMFGPAANIMNQRVKLNVGGKIFETLLSTLQKAGEESNLGQSIKSQLFEVILT